MQQNQKEEPTDKRKAKAPVTKVPKKREKKMDRKQTLKGDELTKASTKMKTVKSSEPS